MPFAVVLDTCVRYPARLRAVPVVDEYGPDVVLMDVRMPGMDGP